MFPSIRRVTALTRAVSGEKQIYSGNLEILPGIGKPGKFFGKYRDIFETMSNDNDNDLINLINFIDLCLLLSLLYSYCHVLGL